MHNIASHPRPSASKLLCNHYSAIAQNIPLNDHEIVLVKSAVDIKLHKSTYY